MAVVKSILTIDTSSGKASIKEFATTTDTALKGVEKKSKKSAKAVGDGFSKAFKRAAAAVGIFVLARRALELEPVAQGFDSLTKSIGASSEAMLTGLRTATEGAISDLELMTLTNQAVALGVANSQKEFERLASGAVRLGRALGLGPTQALQSLTTGIGRQSALVLDNLGILVKAEASNLAYAQSIGKTVDQLTAEEKKLAFQKAAIEALDVRVAKLGDTTSETSNDIAQLQAAFSNLLNELVQSEGFKALAETGVSIANDMVPALLDVVEVASPLIGSIAGIASNITKLLVPAIQLVNEIMGPLVGWIKNLTDAADDLIDRLDDSSLVEARKKLAQANDGVARSIALLSSKEEISLGQKAQVVRLLFAEKNLLVEKLNSGKELTNAEEIRIATIIRLLAKLREVGKRTGEVIQKEKDLAKELETGGGVTKLASKTLENLAKKTKEFQALFAGDAANLGFNKAVELHGSVAKDLLDFYSKLGLTADKDLIKIADAYLEGARAAEEAKAAGEAYFASIFAGSQKAQEQVSELATHVAEMVEGITPDKLPPLEFQIGVKDITPTGLPANFAKGASQLGSVFTKEFSKAIGQAFASGGNISEIIKRGLSAAIIATVNSAQFKEALNRMGLAISEELSDSIATSVTAGVSIFASGGSLEQALGATIGGIAGGKIGFALGGKLGAQIGTAIGTVAGQFLGDLIDGPSTQQLMEQGGKNAGKIFGAAWSSQAQSAFEATLNSIPKAASGKVDVLAAMWHPNTVKEVLENITDMGLTAQNTWAANLEDNVKPVLINTLGMTESEAAEAMAPLFEEILSKLEPGAPISESMQSMIDWAQQLGVDLSNSFTTAGEAAREMLRGTLDDTLSFLDAAESSIKRRDTALANFFKSQGTQNELERIQKIATDILKDGKVGLSEVQAAMAGLSDAGDDALKAILKFRVEQKELNADEKDLLASEKEATNEIDAATGMQDDWTDAILGTNNAYRETLGIVNGIGRGISGIANFERFGDGGFSVAAAGEPVATPPITSPGFTAGGGQTVNLTINATDAGNIETWLSNGGDRVMANAIGDLASTGVN